MNTLNLKLGYGGTAREMARLINDSGVLGDKLLDLSSSTTLNQQIQDAGGFATIVKAINAVNVQMGIAGTTAKEASDTILGSGNALAAAWTNWLTGVGQDEADYSALTENLITSAQNYLNNAVPRIGTIVANLFVAGPQLIQGIKDNSRNIVNSLIDSLEEVLEGTPFGGFLTWFQDLLNGSGGILDLFSQASEKFHAIIDPIVSYIGSNFIEPIKNTLIPLREAYGSTFESIQNSFFTAFGTLAGYAIPVMENLKGIFEKLQEPISKIVSNLSENFFTAFNAGLVIFGEVLLDVSEKIGPLVENVVGGILALSESFFGWLNEALNSDTVNGIVEWISGVADGIINPITQLSELIKPIIEDVTGIFQAMGPVIMNVLSGLSTALSAIIPVIVEFAKSFLTEHFEGFKNVIEKIGEAIPRIFAVVQPILERVMELLGHLLDAILPLFEPVLNLICAAIDLICGALEYLWPIIQPLVDLVIGFFEALVDFVSPVLGTVIDFLAQIVSWLGDMAGVAGNTFGIVIGWFEDLGWNVENLRTLFSNVVDFITRPFKEAFNAVAGFWNDTIGSLTWEVPDWVPVFGGSTIEAPKLPLLAEGGVVTSATQAIIGEAGPEMVLPLEHPKAEALLNRYSYGSDVNPEDIKKAILEALAGWSFNVNGEKMAHATRSDFDIVNGKANALLERGLANV